jgi:hypothetical protein
MNKTLCISIMLSITILAFIALQVTIASATISSGEYFIDTDPGEGNGIAIPPKDGSFDETMEDVEFFPDTSNLTIGVHNLYIRMKNSEEVWGTPRKVMFEVTGDLNIAGAEYFIDTDPGAGNGTPIPASDGAYNDAIESCTIAINTSNLSLGLHTLYVRAKNSEGHWGTPRQHKIEIVQPPIIAAAEYYIDTDPGIGMGTALDPKDGNFDSEIEYLLGTLNTSSLGFGTHELFVRAKDSYGRWGAVKSAKFTIISPPVIDGITFDECISDLCTSHIHVTAHDPEGGTLTYTYETLDGGTIIGEGPDVQFVPPGTSSPPSCNPYRVKVTIISNSTGLSTDKTIGITAKLAGDINGDGAVNILDKILVRNCFGMCGTPDCIEADVNCDGCVNVLDKIIVRNDFGKTGCSCPQE